MVAKGDRELPQSRIDMQRAPAPSAFSIYLSYTYKQLLEHPKLLFDFKTEINDLRRKQFMKAEKNGKCSERDQKSKP